MTYLRIAATYLVQRPNGERLLVDQFESTRSPAYYESGSTSEKLFLLRNGEQARFVNEQTLQLNSGERLTILDAQ
jgi:hypothetical protein